MTTTKWIWWLPLVTDRPIVFLANNMGYYRLFGVTHSLPLFFVFFISCESSKGRFKHKIPNGMIFLLNHLNRKLITMSPPSNNECYSWTKENTVYYFSIGLLRDWKYSMVHLISTRSVNLWVWCKPFAAVSYCYNFIKLDLRSQMTLQWYL